MSIELLQISSKHFTNRQGQTEPQKKLDIELRNYRLPFTIHKITLLERKAIRNIHNTIFYCTVQRGCG